MHTNDSVYGKLLCASSGSTNGVCHDYDHPLLVEIANRVNSPDRGIIKNAYLRRHAVPFVQYAFQSSTETGQPRDRELLRSSAGRLGLASRNRIRSSISSGAVNFSTEAPPRLYKYAHHSIRVANVDVERWFKKKQSEQPRMFGLWFVRGESPRQLSLASPP